MVFDLGKRGGRVIFTLDDRSGRLEASMFEDVWQQYRTLVAKSAILIVEGPRCASMSTSKAGV